MSDDKKTVWKRVQALITVGGIPATICGFVGDLFNPAGGWLFPGILGVFALILSVYLLASLTLNSDRVAETWWVRFTGEDMKWIWVAKSPFLAHGFHIVIVFGAVCLFLAQKSFAASGDGGILAKNIDAIAVAQKQLGITEKILNEQVKANKTLERIDSKADNFKLENSNDPRKELANMGILWGPGPFGQAINDNDIKTVELFLKGGMRISDEDVLRATRPINPLMLDILVKYNQLFKQPNCGRLFGFVLDRNNIDSTDKRVVSAIKGLCSYGSNQAFVSQKLKEEESEHARKEASYKAALKNRKTAKECQHELMKEGNQLLEEASRFNYLSKTTLAGREMLLAKLNIALVFGGNEKKIMEEIKNYCEENADVKPPYDIEGKGVKYWKTISVWTR